MIKAIIFTLLKKTGKLKRGLSRAGFTIVEVLTASVIMLIVLTATLSTYVLLSQYVRDTASQGRLQSKTRVAVDRMVRDIRLASSVTCAPSGVSIILDYDPVALGLGGGSWQTEYKLQGGQILFLSGAGTTVVLDNVFLDAGDLLFQYDGGNHIVTINARTENSYLNSKQSAEFITIVGLRNAE